MKNLILLMVLMLANIACREKSPQELFLEKMMEESREAVSQTPEERIEKSNNALRKKPIDHDAYLIRGGAYEMIGKVEEAYSDYNKSIELALVSKDKYAYNTLSSAYLQRGYIKRDSTHYKEAIADFDSAIVINPDNAYAYFARGVLKCKIGKKIEGCSDLQNSLEISPDDDVFRREIKRYCK